MGGFNGPNQRKYDPFSNTYNPGWRDHPNLRYGNPQGQQANTNFQPYRPPHMQRQNPNMMSTAEGKSSLEEALQTLTTNTLTFQRTTEASMRSLEASIRNLVNQQRNFENQLSQIAAAVNRLESQNSGNFPSQPEINPRQSANAITLRSGKELPEPMPKASKREIEEEITHLPEEKQKVVINKVLPPPFPSRLAKVKKEEQEKEILETFRKVQVNIPLLDAIKQIPRYAKFLKELCTSKRKMELNGKVQLDENVSAILQKKKLPPKCQDPGMFTIPCQIGNLRIERAMLDLGASINVMPYDVYKSLNIGPLKETNVVIQLADRSNVHPKGVLEDILVQVGNMLFPADFYILQMDTDDTSSSTPILFGRPFLKTARTKIDVHDGSLTMEFDGDLIKFNIYNTMKIPDDEQFVVSVDFIDTWMQEDQNFGIIDDMELEKESASIEELKEKFTPPRDPIEDTSRGNGRKELVMVNTAIHELFHKFPDESLFAVQQVDEIGLALPTYL